MVTMYAYSWINTYYLCVADVYGMKTGEAKNQQLSHRHINGGNQKIDKIVQ